MVSVKQTKTQVDLKIVTDIDLNDKLLNLKQLLGNPYHSRCLASGHKLKYFDMYTEKHCYHECSVESIAQECKCRFVRKKLASNMSGIRSKKDQVTILLEHHFFRRK